MKQIRNLSLTLLTLVSLWGCSTSRELPISVKVTKANQTSDAFTNNIVYGLPKTAFSVEVVAEKSINKTGPFYRYAEKYLSLSEVITEDNETWEIKSIKLIPYGKPDTARLYSIQMTGPGAAQNLKLTPNGILCGINTDVPCPCQSKPTFVSTKELTLNDVNFDDVPRLEKQLVATSSATMAEETAKYIYKLRKRRSRLFTSDFQYLPPDGQAYEISDKESEALEKSFTELFAGKTVRQQITQSFEVIPDRQGGESTVLFRFSSHKGFVDRMDLSGTPVYIEVKNITELQLNEPVKSSKKEVTNGLFYQLPGRAIVKVIDRNELLLEQEIEVAQFGQTLSLPATLMEQPGLSIEMSPSTGAILNITTKK